MGQQVSHPRPGTTLKVIGAGLPRTGTASLSKALEILYEEPVYHGGTQNCRGDGHQFQTWTTALKHTPIRSDSDEAAVFKACREQLDGFVAVTDLPACLFVPELLKLYPDAVVICTIRDPDEWLVSYGSVANHALQAFLGIFLLPVPTMRWSVAYLNALAKGRWNEVLQCPGGTLRPVRGTWDKHVEWLRTVVPEEKLIFFDVRDGWAPLCKALGKDIPKGLEFPRVNEAADIDNFAAKTLQNAAKRWAIIFGAGFALLGFGWKLYSKLG